MRYVIFTILGLLFALTAFQMVYERLSPEQRCQVACFIHAATARDCIERGWVRL